VNRPAGREVVPQLLEVTVEVLHHLFLLLSHHARGRHGLIAGRTVRQLVVAGQNMSLMIVKK
jgi:hypothetical protein